MPQWGANQTDESKPKNLTEEQKSRTFATTRGWEINRVDGTTEVLVAIRNLSGGDSSSTKLGAAEISAVYFLSTSYTTGATGRVRVAWNERITPTTTGTLVVKQTNATSNAVTNITATRAGNTTSNFIDYTFAVGNTTAFSYTIGAQTITQGINDYGQTGVTSDVTIATSNVVYAVAAASGSTGVTVTAS